jgi:hypothetical protein
MKQILLKIALFFSLMTIPIVILFLMPYSKEFAYHYIENDCYNHGAWIFDRITKNKVQIDVAFIGSSHTIHAFQEKKMEESLGQNYHLANFGYCRYGRNLQYTILKLLLQHKSPKLIVLEVCEDEEKNSHDIFPYLAETDDLLFTPTLINRDYFSDLYYGASARLECFKETYIFNKKVPEPDNGLYGYGEAERTATKEEMTDNEKAWQRRLKRKTFKSVEDVQLRYPLAYLKKMVELVKEKNISLVFVYLPESGSKLKVPKLVEYYQSIAPLLIPPKSVFDDSTNWMDASHLNDKGSEILSEWMANQLKNELCINPEH